MVGGNVGERVIRMNRGGWEDTQLSRDCVSCDLALCISDAFVRLGLLL